MADQTTTPAEVIEAIYAAIAAVRNYDAAHRGGPS